MARDEAELKQLEERISKEQSQLKKVRLEAELKAKREDFRKRVKDFDDALKEKREELDVDMRGKLSSLAKLIAESKGYEVVVDELQSAMLFIQVPKPREDITNVVIEEFDKVYK